MIKSRFNYWSCSKFADWIRGTPKPFALEWNQWAEWKGEVKTKNPIRYWLAEEGLDILQDCWMFPSDIYNAVRIYVRNRWIDQTHIIKTGLKPGHYHEIDTKILHGLFNELVDYVEGELAHTMKEDCGIMEGDRRYGKITPQAISAQKVKELYIWWTKIRPIRPEPYYLSGMSQFEGNEFFSKKSKEEIKSMHNMVKLEEQYDKEDTDKLIELIKIRKELWT